MDLCFHSPISSRHGIYFTRQHNLTLWDSKGRETGKGHTLKTSLKNHQGNVFKRIWWSNDRCSYDTNMTIYHCLIIISDKVRAQSWTSSTQPNNLLPMYVLFPQVIIHKVFKTSYISTGWYTWHCLGLFTHIIMFILIWVILIYSNIIVGKWVNYNINPPLFINF